MLQRIGDALKGTEGSGKRKWITYFFVGALSIVFAAWGAYGIVNLSFGEPNYAAEAGGTKITLEQARNTWLREQAQWQQRLGGAEIPAALRARLQDQVLEAMIRDALLDKRTHDLGYRVGHDELIEAVKAEPAFQINGQYSPAAASDALARAGFTSESFQERLRSDLQRSQLENAIRASDFLTPVELARVRELEDQEREVRTLVLPADKFPGAPVDDAAVAAWYPAHEQQYLTPESAAQTRGSRRRIHGERRGPARAVREREEPAGYRGKAPRAPRSHPRLRPRRRCRGAQAGAGHLRPSQGRQGLRRARQAILQGSGLGPERRRPRLGR
jgi:hypothetical protein